MPTTGMAPRPVRNWVDQILDFPRPAGLSLTGLLIAIIALLDAMVYARISLGMLYTVPLMFSSLFLSRLQVVSLAVALAFLREQFHPYSWDTDGVTRLAYVTVSHVAAALFSGELARNRRLVLSHYDEIKREIRLRQEAEQQLRTLIESSPAAIVMLEPDGRVDLANEAAHRLLGLETGALPGRRIGEYIPMMAELLTEHAAGKPYRAAAHCRGRRASGESFLACTWFSTFDTQRGARLAAIITDSSDDIRDLQESSLQSLLRSTRVLVGSVSHEIRNMCAAIGVVHANLGRIPGIGGNEDYQALGMLAQGLTRVATLELQNSTDIEVDAVDIHELLEEFSIVESPAIESTEAQLRLSVEPGLPSALGDRHGLLQVLLNLTRNSLRAMENSPLKQLEISAMQDGDSILIVHQDSGPGISNVDGLFKPFRSGVDSAGLGLFVSRAIVRACGGDLAHEPSPQGCRMVIRLRIQQEDSSSARSQENVSSEVRQ
ncbi:MAG: PAS domain-containing sensor histidine kinase [Bryobacteraceae bacterium]|nr:PAS domain-containing sensor histidine kinase [Bryobacteraceae bacterium]